MQDINQKGNLELQISVFAKVLANLKKKTNWANKHFNAVINNIFSTSFQKFFIV